jgi:hypothetical protein
MRTREGEKVTAYILYVDTARVIIVGDIASLKIRMYDAKYYTKRGRKLLSENSAMRYKDHVIYCTYTVYAKEKQKDFPRETLILPIYLYIIELHIHIIFSLFLSLSLSLYHSLAKILIRITSDVWLGFKSSRISFQLFISARGKSSRRGRRFSFVIYFYPALTHLFAYTSQYVYTVFENYFLTMANTTLHRNSTYCID